MNLFSFFFFFFFFLLRPITFNSHFPRFTPKKLFLICQPCFPLFQLLNSILFFVLSTKKKMLFFFLLLLLSYLVSKQFKQTLSKAPMAFQVLSFASSFLFIYFYHWLSLSSYLLWLSSIHNLRITYPWVDVIRNSKVFDDCLLPTTNLKISNKRLCAWTGCLRKDIGKASFYLFWHVSKKFLCFFFLIMNSLFIF